MQLKIASVYVAQKQMTCPQERYHKLSMSCCNSRAWARALERGPVKPPRSRPDRIVIDDSEYGAQRKDVDERLNASLFVT